MLRSSSSPSKTSMLRRRSSTTVAAEQQLLEEIELFQYEWPDLPPIENIKEAVTRNIVSGGINYLLPVDKSKNSVENNYRTNLKYMFQEPYSEEGKGFDCQRLGLSVKHHLTPNTVPSKYKPEAVKHENYILSSDMEKVRKKFARSAPKNGKDWQKLCDKNLRTRSCLFIPLKAKHNPEVEKLKKEVKRIMASVAEDFDDSMFIDTDTKSTKSRNKSILRRRSTLQDSNWKLYDSINYRNNSSASEPNRIPNKTKQYESYEDFKSRHFSSIPDIPDDLISPFLDKEKSIEIWKWLHEGDLLDDFDHFLNICE